MNLNDPPPNLPPPVPVDAGPSVQPAFPADAAFEAWMSTPAGRYAQAWEQAQLDRTVADIFGFHAVQLGASGLHGLRANRMPHRWLAVTAHGSEGIADGAPAVDDDAASGARIDLYCDFDALPFKDQSLDLVVMPHTLELARDPHATLREVQRVLVPDGRVVICGFNGASLWGAKQRTDRLAARLGGKGPLFLPSRECIGHRRLRDWLRLVSIEVEGGRFGCYAPPMQSSEWLERMGWMDKTGDRWWPVFGAVYFLVGVKRVRGMRLVGLAKREKSRVGAAPAVLTRLEPHVESESRAPRMRETENVE
jgi:SAM-dependent methyltransferase